MATTGDDRVAPQLEGMRVAVLVADGVEDLEYWVTVMRLREAGAVVRSVGITLDRVTGKNGLLESDNLLEHQFNPC